MKLEILSTSAVVLAQDHNPTILHPSFLVGQEIVPNDWKLAQDPVCTSGISVVRYDNGIVFMAEPGKFQVIANVPAESGISCDYPAGLLSHYVKSVPHVRYTAVGVNVAGFIECSDSEALLVELFLKPGAWNSEKMKPTAIGLRLVYPDDDAKFTLNYEPGQWNRAEAATSATGIAINGNFHTDLAEGEIVEQVTSRLGRFSERLKRFDAEVHAVFTVED